MKSQAYRMGKEARKKGYKVLKDDPEFMKKYGKKDVNSSKEMEELGHAVNEYYDGYKEEDKRMKSKPSGCRVSSRKVRITPRMGRLK